MKYLILFLAMPFVACTSIKQMKPDHVGISSGLKVEIMEGYKNIITPDVRASVDWDL